MTRSLSPELAAVLVTVAIVLALADVLMFALASPPAHVPLVCVGNRGCPGDPGDPLHRGTRALPSR